jgi:hypothetical protein
MFVYTTQQFNKGTKIHVCLQCLEDSGHKENSFSVEPINWKEHTEATCTICGKTEYRFAFERS